MSKLTEKDCLLEIERTARLMSFYKQDSNDAENFKQDSNDAENFKKNIKCTLSKLDEIRKIAADKKAEREAAAYRRKMGIKDKQEQSNTNYRRV
jgi:hypothetical protein